jgi:hypothetical protein
MSVAEAIEDLQTARRWARGHVLIVGRSRGEGVTELADALGISRQLAHRNMDELE